MPDRYETLGYALAMRVLQSDLYPLLDDQEREEVRVLIARGQKKPALIEPVLKSQHTEGALSTVAELNLIEGVQFRPHTGGVALFTVAYFSEQARLFEFSHGHGRFATLTHASDVPVVFGQIHDEVSLRTPPPWATHVVWFNFSK